MSSFELNGKTYETDGEGYLVQPRRVEAGSRRYMAKGEKVEMTPSHWEVVNFLRDYYNEYQIAPAVRVLTKAIGKKLGPEKGNASTSTSCSRTARRNRRAKSPAFPSRPAASTHCPPSRSPTKELAPCMSALTIAYAGAVLRGDAGARGRHRREDPQLCTPRRHR